MKTSFLEEGGQRAIKYMKNNKSMGMDDLTMELMEYRPFE